MDYAEVFSYPGDSQTFQAELLLALWFQVNSLKNVDIPSLIFHFRE